MTTRYPRLQVTIDPELDAVLEGLADLQGRPKATIVRQWLVEATPAFLSAVEALRVVKGAPAVAARAIVGALDAAEAHGRQVGLSLRRKAGRPRKSG